MTFPSYITHKKIKPCTMHRPPLELKSGQETPSGFHYIFHRAALPYKNNHKLAPLFPIRLRNDLDVLARKDDDFFFFV